MDGGALFWVLWEDHGGVQTQPCSRKRGCQGGLPGGDDQLSLKESTGCHDFSIKRHMIQLALCRAPRAVLPLEQGWLVFLWPRVVWAEGSSVLTRPAGGWGLQEVLSQTWSSRGLCSRMPSRTTLWGSGCHPKP